MTIKIVSFLHPIDNYFCNNILLVLMVSVEDRSTETVLGTEFLLI
jgi:hypothetical protein